MEPLILTGKDLTLEDLWQVACDNRPVEIAPEAYARLARGREIMLGLAAGGKKIYGLNTGLGWNKDQKIDADFLEKQNRMILRSHALGLPPYNTDVEVRAMMVIRLNNMLIGASCASDDLANVYRDFLNHGITPRIPKRGAVGAGDITTITHMGRAFIGEGEVSYKGKIVRAKEAVEAEGLTLYRLQLKDAHTILISNCQGEAMAAVLVREVEDLLKMSDLIYCLNYEGLNGNVEAMTAEVNAIRGLPGQIRHAARCREYLEGSYLYQPDPNRALQDALTFRCGFAITGAVSDALEFVKKYLTIQINSPCENPCMVQELEQTFVSANFESTTMAQGVEMLTISLYHLSRAINYRMIKMCMPEFTGLTRFLAPRDGSSHGYDEIQNTFSTLDAENRTLVNPASVDFYQMQGGIEDHATNLPLVASRAQQLVDNLKYMVGMEALYAAQAVDLRRDIQEVRLGKYTGVAHETIRRFIPTLDGERNIFDDIMNAHALICSNELLKGIEDVE